jgi:hypothetical protein
VIQTFSPGSTWREAWMSCASGYTAISAQVYVASSSNSTARISPEPGTWTTANSNALNATAGGGPTTGAFTATADGGTSPNAYHFATSGNIALGAALKLVVVCIPN